MRKIILIPLILILFLAYTYASPQLTINTLTWTQNALINISTKDVNDDSKVNISFITIRCSSPSTANSSTSNIYNISNSSATNFDLGYANFTFGSNLVLEDSNDYTCNAISTNGTITSASVTATIDRTAPSAPTSIQFTNPVDDTNTITATVTGTDTTNCYIRFGSPQVEGRAMTHSGNTCTFTVGQNNPPNGDYQTFIEASDKTNSTLSSVQSITIRAVKSDGGGLWGGTLVSTNPSAGQSAVGAPSNPFIQKDNKSALAFIILILIYLYYRSKK